MNKGYHKKGLLRIDVENGYMPPMGYGLAYWRYDTPLAVCYPLGINWIVWVFREIYFKIRKTPRGFESISYNIGYSDGFDAAKIIYDKEYE